VTIFFRPDTVLPNDPAGFGLWLIGHYLEHKQFITSALTLTPPQTIPDYAIQSWNDDPAAVASWLNAHEQIHVALRAVSNITGIDLSAVDLTDEDEFFEWMDDHRTEHALFRGFFSIT
jgi:hypothetical protein